MNESSAEENLCVLMLRNPDCTKTLYFNTGIE